MTPGKEHLKYFEDLEKKQVRMFGDACDSGVWSHSPELKTMIRNHVKALASIYKMKTERWDTGSSVEFFIPFEMESSTYVGVTLKVSLNRTGHLSEFFSIDIFRSVQSGTPFKR